MNATQAAEPLCGCWTCDRELNLALHALKHDELHYLVQTLATEGVRDLAIELSREIVEARR